MNSIPQMELRHKQDLQVTLNEEVGLLEFKGKSIIEDSEKFYDPVFNWVEQYGKTPKHATTVNMFLEYFNTVSSKYIIALLRKLDELHRSGGSQVLVNWHYEEGDEDMMYLGEEFQEAFKMPVKVIETNEFDFYAN